MIIFDFDGVIVDSERLVNVVLAELVTALGVPMSGAEAARVFTGKVTADCLQILRRDYGLTLPGDFADRYEDAVTAVYERELVVVPGIVEVLEAMPGRRCIASGSSHARIAHALGIVGLRHHFEGRVHSAEDVARGKPEPDVFLYAAARMGVAPADCVVVEDSITGITAARRAGMPVYGLIGTFGAPELEAAGAEPVQRLTDLLLQPRFQKAAGWS